jgi:ribosomal protein S10
MLDETLTTIPAYFDGEQIRLRVPFVLPTNANLLVTVLEKPQADGERAKKIARFLKLKGIYKNDQAFDEAMDYLDKAWKAWQPTDFA